MKSIKTPSPKFYPPVASTIVSKPNKASFSSLPADISPIHSRTSNVPLASRLLAPTQSWSSLEDRSQQSGSIDGNSEIMLILENPSVDIHDFELTKNKEKEKKKSEVEDKKEKEVKEKKERKVFENDANVEKLQKYFEANSSALGDGLSGKEARPTFGLSRQINSPLRKSENTISRKLSFYEEDVEEILKRNLIENNGDLNLSLIADFVSKGNPETYTKLILESLESGEEIGTTSQNPSDLPSFICTSYFNQVDKVPSVSKYRHSSPIKTPALRNVTNMTTHHVTPKGGVFSSEILLPSSMHIQIFPPKMDFGTISQSCSLTKTLMICHRVDVVLQIIGSSLFTFDNHSQLLRLKASDKSVIPLHLVIPEDISSIKGQLACSIKIHSKNDEVFVPISAIIGITKLKTGRIPNYVHCIANGPWQNISIPMMNFGDIPLNISFSLQDSSQTLEFACLPDTIELIPNIECRPMFKIRSTAMGEKSVFLFLKTLPNGPVYQINIHVKSPSSHTLFPIEVSKTFITFCLSSSFSVDETQRVSLLLKNPNANEHSLSISISDSSNVFYIVENEKSCRNTKLTIPSSSTKKIYILSKVTSTLERGKINLRLQNDSSCKACIPLLILPGECGAISINGLINNNTLIMDSLQLVTIANVGTTDVFIKCSSSLQDIVPQALIIPQKESRSLQLNIHPSHILPGSTLSFYYGPEICRQIIRKSNPNEAIFCGINFNHYFNGEEMVESYFSGLTSGDNLFHQTIRKKTVELSTHNSLFVESSYSPEIKFSVFPKTLNLQLVSDEFKIKVSNESKEITIHWKTSSVLNFQLFPSNGLLNPSESTFVSVTPLTHNLFFEQEEIIFLASYSITNEESSSSWIKESCIISAKKTRKEVYFDREEMSYPTTKINTVTTIKVLVKNRTKDSVRLSVSHLGNPFSTEHKEIIIKPLSYLGFPVKFSPTSQGVFKRKILLKNDKIILVGTLIGLSVE